MPPPETVRSWSLFVLSAEYFFLIFHVLLTVFGPCTALYVISFLYLGTPAGTYGYVLFILVILTVLVSLGLAVVNFYGRFMTLNKKWSSLNRRRFLTEDEVLIASGGDQSVLQESEGAELNVRVNPTCSWISVSEVSQSRTKGGPYKKLCSSKTSPTSSGDEKKVPDDISLPPIENKPKEKDAETKSVDEYPVQKPADSNMPASI